MVYPRVLAVGDRAATVELGSSLDLETVGRVRALDERVAEKGVRGVLETVPTYAALLVIYDPRQTSFASMSATFIELATSLQPSLLPGRLMEIPVRYDGEDLAEVAQACGVSPDAVVDMHSSPEYSVLMLGFSPGFPYLGFVDPRLRVPRRNTPRTRVPRGAVAVAGAQTGIYPRSLPGGWNLLGHTGRQLFDAGAPVPSLLMPGDRVRFRPASAVEPTTEVSSPTYSGGGVLVVEAGSRAYVAISGLEAPRLLGSASVDLGSGFLRPLQGGDRLSIGSFDADRAQRATSLIAASQGAVRVILGPQQDHFDPGTIATFLSTAWLVGRDSDRVGARLDGPRLRHVGATEIVSDGMVPGCIQVPPDGRPIVMLSDCPTTGGYPKIACVVSDDIGAVAQAADGKTPLRFAAVRIEDL